MIRDVNLPDFDKGNIIVVGDAMLDRYWSGDTDRISPEAPVPVVHVNDTISRPGGAANVAVNASMVGSKVTLFSVIGDDAEGDELTAELNLQGIQCEFINIERMQTTTKLRVLSHHQQLLRLDFEKKMELSAAHFELMYQRYVDALKTTKAVVISDYAKGSLAYVTKLIKTAREHGVPVLVDPKTKDFSVYSGATIITPNLKEFEAVVGPCDNNDEIIATKAQALIAAHQFEAILITRGKDGMSLIYADPLRRPCRLSAKAREVFDVTGAGDTVIGLMAAGIAAGANLEDASIIANLAAGLVVRKLGTATVTLSELRSALQNDYRINTAVLTEDELIRLVEEARIKKEKIIMTNGCFDIIHSGHVEYLNAAKELGARLIIAVNDDDSVKRLKGESRPLNALSARMDVLSSLKPVDWVVPFSEDTPARLIAKVLPDVLVKGGDYQPHEIAGGEAVIENGGEVIVLPFKEGFSTTGLVEKILELEEV